MGASPTMPRNCSSYSQTLRVCYFEQLGADLEKLVDGSHSDLVITVQGRDFPLHRCILSARCSFFREYLRDGGTEELKAELDLETISTLEGVGCESFLAVIKYIYGGRVRFLGSGVACLDSTCSHEACWPAVNYALDLLRTASVFKLPELVAVAEQHLLSSVEEVPVEYLLTMLVIARTHEVVKLQTSCLDTLAKAKLNYLSLEKLLPIELVEAIKTLKKERGHSTADEQFDKQARRVQRALDSDDVELVQLLLKEGNVNFDDVFGLHYATAYCDEKTVRELLDLQLSDPNSVNYRGLTVLHIACMRREPEILAGLLAKGARSREPTPDKRTACQIVKRLTKAGETSEEESQRAKLCLEILEQAETATMYSKSFRDMIQMPITGEKELVQKLLYLENRVALARVLFPREAQIVMNLAHLETTSEFRGVDRSSPHSPSGSSSPSYLVRKDVRPRHIVGGAMQFEKTVTGLDTSLLQRVAALQKTAELGHRFFPRCTAILNKYMDDEPGDLTTNMEIEESEELSSKKQRLSELKDILAEAFTKDVADMDQQRSPSDFLP